MNAKTVLEFYKGKKVLITGNTGFKGSWLTFILQMAGADITGFSLKPPTCPNLFDIASLSDNSNTITGDIRNYKMLSKVVNSTNPEIVFHLAAQPIVLDGYDRPLYTYETNVMGTVNLLESIRHLKSIKSIVNVTTDKVYQNKENASYGYSESDRLNGFDPYSNSKSCSELVTHSYVNSFFQSTPCSVSTARAGNVIGGGDFAPNRIIPDCVRAIQNDTPLIIRNPTSTRPYQHVLEPLFAYLLIARCQFDDANFAGAYNVGPNDDDCVTTEELVNLFSKHIGDRFRWEARPNDDMPHEASYLKLDSSKLKKTFGWHPRWKIDQAVEKTAAWTKAWLEGNNIRSIMESQISEYIEENGDA